MRWFRAHAQTQAYLSAVTLCGFLVGSVFVPFFVMDRRYPSSLLFGLSMLAMTVCFAVVPSIIGSDDFPEAKFTWRLFGFVCAKFVVSLCFAVTQATVGAMSTDAIGVANLPIIFIYLYHAAAPGAAGGPIAAWLITWARRYDGMPFARAFHLWFYIAAGLCGASMLCAIVLWRLLVRSAAADQGAARRAGGVEVPGGGAPAPCALPTVSLNDTC